MSSLKDDWKTTGKSLGGAFANLGKSVIHSIDTGLDKANDWAEDNNDSKENQNVNAEQNNQAKIGLSEDWSKTGKSMGNAFSNLGKTLIKSVNTGVEKANEWAEEDNTVNNNEQDSE